MPTKIFDADDWSIELTLYGGYEQEIELDRVIATAMGDVRTLSPEIEIRQALELKGKRYGAMTTARFLPVKAIRSASSGPETKTSTSTASGSGTGCPARPAWRRCSSCSAL
jgi:hypothetical protein